MRETTEYSPILEGIFAFHTTMESYIGMLTGGKDITEANIVEITNIVYAEVCNEHSEVFKGAYDSLPLEQRAGFLDELNCARGYDLNANEYMYEFFPVNRPVWLPIGREIVEEYVRGIFD